MLVPQAAGRQIGHDRVAVRTDVHRMALDQPAGAVEHMGRQGLSGARTCVFGVHGDVQDPIAGQDQAVVVRVVVVEEIQATFMVHTSSHRVGLCRSIVFLEVFSIKRVRDGV